MNWENFKRFYGKIKSAVKHPLFPLGALLFLTLWGIVGYLPPTFSLMVEGMEIELPLHSRLLLATGSFLGTYWYITLPISVWGVTKLVSTQAGKRCLSFLERINPVWLDFLFLAWLTVIIEFVVISMFLPPIVTIGGVTRK